MGKGKKSGGVGNETEWGKGRRDGKERKGRTKEGYHLVLAYTLWYCLKVRMNVTGQQYTSKETLKARTCRTKRKRIGLS